MYIGRSAALPVRGHAGVRGQGGEFLVELCHTAYGKDLFVEVRVTATNLVARSRVNYL